MSLKWNFAASHSTVAKLVTIQFLLLLFINQCHSISFSDLLKYFSSSKCGYESCETGKSGYLNVHLVPHTHDDVGWLKTVDQYYYGTNNTIQQAGVQYILDSVVSALAHNPKRRFTYVEIVYFYQWWMVQSKEIQHLVKDSVETGRLQFASGGWSMADEATVYYTDAIDQLTLGLAWQIDPFGHARDHSDLFQDAGFDAVYFQRMDFREKEKRKQLKELEILWHTTSNEKSTNVYEKTITNTKLYDNPSIQEYNVDSIVKKFQTYIHHLSKSFKTNHIMVLMGCDFTYENAHINYNNMDKLIKYVNAAQEYGSKINLLYSTPACYTKAVNEEFNRIGTINHRSGDFFPYASGQFTYWTGYYTSRPSLKYYVRQASNLLSMCEHIHLFANRIPNKLTNKTNQYDNEERIDNLRKILGILQHHDAVTGTAKQHVTNDYTLRLYTGSNSCQNLIGNSYIKLLPNLKFKSHSGLTFCDLLNISLCNATENYQPVYTNDVDDGVFILLYNSLGWEQSSTWIRFPIYIPDSSDDGGLLNKFQIILKDLRNSLKSHQSLPYQLNFISQRTLQIPERMSSQHRANYEVLFNAKNVSPVGLNIFHFTINRTSSPSVSTSSTKQNPTVHTQTINFKQYYDQVGNFTQIIMKHVKSGIEINLKIELLYYEGETERPQPSGAYVFLPKRESHAKEFTSVRGNLSYRILCLFIRKIP
ncbi:unnamed protein product [Schistosoma turkestanicum]|nr:unnamed protein product [Schistosoma turkestanicum]